MIWPRGHMGFEVLASLSKRDFFVTCRQLVYFEILLLPNSTTRSGVARNVNWGASPALPVPPPLPLLTGVRGYNPRNFFLKLKVLVGEF